LTTEKLSASIMDAMGNKSSNNQAVYIRHLALFVSNLIYHSGLPFKKGNTFFT